MSAQPIFAPRSGWGWGMFEGACEESHTPVQGCVRSLDCARKLAPLGMTRGTCKAPLSDVVMRSVTIFVEANGLAPLGMTLGRRRR